MDERVWYVTIKVSLEEFIEISKNSYFWEEGWKGNFFSLHDPFISLEFSLMCMCYQPLHISLRGKNGEGASELRNQSSPFYLGDAAYLPLCPSSCYYLRDTGFVLIGSGYTQVT